VWAGRTILTAVVSVLLALPATAPAAGTVATGSAYNVGQTQATLAGSLSGDWTCSSSDTRGEFGYVGFEHGPSAGNLYASVSGSCEGGKSFTAPIPTDDLWPGTPHHFRATFQRAGTTHYAETRSFRTAEDVPLVVRPAVSEVEATSATFRAEIQDGGRLTTWRVLYGPADATTLTNVTPTRSIAGDGGEPEEVVAFVDDLEPGVEYAYVVEATNAHGTDDAEGLPFTTPGVTVPDVTTLTPVEVTATSALLRGTIDQNGRTVGWQFLWGPTSSSHAFETPIETLSASDGLVDVSVRITGLSPGTSYHYLLLAANDLYEEDVGADVSFTTLPARATTTDGGASGSEDSGAPLVPVSPGGKVVPPSAKQPLRATAEEDAAPIDVLAGVVARGVSGRSVGALRRGLAVRRVPVPAAGRLEAVLRPAAGTRALAARAPVIARAVRRTTRAGATDLRLRVTRAGRAWLRGRRTARLRLTVSFAPARGARTSRTVPLTLGR
jgi:hypothetical protein